MMPSTPAVQFEAVREAVGNVLIGNETVVENLMVALLSGGNILLEGPPGVAKTTVASLFASATGLSYNRIQMTPDILPADITGTHVYRQQTGEFVLREGPIFANLVVADEVNRAPAKAQSALLEAMEEGRVTVEGETRPLPKPFLVLATRNSVEMEGVFALPEAQLDRFDFKLQMDNPPQEDERAMLHRFDETYDLSAEDVPTVLSPEGVLDARERAMDVHVDEKVFDYILAVVTATREMPEVDHGASPRASLTFLNAAKARAAIHGRDYVIYDDVKALAMPVLGHRLILSSDAEFNGVETTDVVDRVLGQVQPPRQDVEPA